MFFGQDPLALRKGMHVLVDAGILLYKVQCLTDPGAGAEEKEYAQAEGVSAGFGVDLESASDLSRGIRVSETAECWEKVQHTSVRPHIDLVPGGNGTGMHLMRADT